MVFDKLSACIWHLTKIAAIPEEELGRLQKVQEELELKAFQGQATEADHALYKANLGKLQDMMPLHTDPGWKAWKPPAPRQVPQHMPLVGAAGLGAVLGGLTGMTQRAMTPKSIQKKHEERVEESGGPISRFALKHPGMHGALGGAAMLTAGEYAKKRGAGMPGMIAASLAPAAASMVADRGLRALEDRKSKFPETPEPHVKKPESGPPVQHPA
jgi:hypothetical protein